MIRDLRMGIGVLALLGAAPATHASDLILINGRIYTGTKDKWAQAIAITGEKIEKVGDNADVLATRSKSSRIVDLHGRFVTPGFIDNHTHIWLGALALANLNLSSPQSNITPEENPALFVARIKEYAAANKHQPVLFVRAAFSRGTPNPGPGLALLDEAVPDRPLIVHNISEHALWVNSRALRLAGVSDKPLPDPVEEEWVERDNHGRPTGLMREPAQQVIERALPKLPADEQARILEGGLKYLNSFGITSAVVLNGGLADLQAFEDLRRRGSLSLRVRLGFAAVSVKHKLTPEFLADLETARRTWHDDWISANLVKFFMDGAPTPPWYNPEEYTRIVTQLDRLGYQIASHALGAAGVTMALDGYEAVQQSNGARDRRQRIEHGGQIASADLQRYARLNVIESAQPEFCCSTSPGTNPWGTLRKQGVTLAFSSDWPCSWPPSPIHGIEQATQRWLRRPVSVSGPQGPLSSDGSEERLTAEQALIAYTRNSAYANFWEDKRGTLEAGKLADIVVMDQNILEISSEQIGNAKVIATIVGGKTVYGSIY